MTQRRRPLVAAALIVTVALISACGSGGAAATGTAAGAGTRSAGNAGSAGDPKASQREKAVKFARCMRASGVSDFPDPGASGQFTIDQVANGSSVDTSTPAFTQALSACKRLEPAGFTGGARSAAQQAAALGFARCVRAHGVTDFPDPINGQPLVDTNRIPSSDTSSGMSILHAAMDKCSNLGAAAGVTR